MKKVIVAGAGGYIGCILSELLLDNGYIVVGLDRFYFGIDRISALRSNRNFICIQNDIRFVEASTFSEVEAIIDLTGISNDPATDLDPKISKSINLDGTINLAQKAKLYGVKRYIFSSSCSVYGEGGSHEMLTETSPLLPVSLYAKLKIDAENALLKIADENFCVTLLRNATVYGYSPRMRFDLIVNIMTMFAVTKEKIYVLGGGKQWRPNLHVKDVAKAFLLAIEAPTNEINRQIFNVGSNEQNYQVLQVANFVKEIIPKTVIEIVPDDIDKRSYNVCFNKIANKLNFKPTHSIKEAIIEVKNAITNNIVDPNDIRTITVKYYKYLIDADTILSEIKINGNLF